MVIHPPTLDHPRNPAPDQHTALLLSCSARPTTRPRQKINVPCNPCIMHSHFVRRTNERTARKFTSHLAPGRPRTSFLLFRALYLYLSLPALSLSRSSSLFLPLLCAWSLSHSLCFSPRSSPRPSLTRKFARGNAPALTNSRPHSLVLSSGRAFLPPPPCSLSPFAGPGSPSSLSLASLLHSPLPADPASSKFRLEIIKLHALTRTCVVRTDGSLSREPPSPSYHPHALQLTRSHDLL